VRQQKGNGGEEETRIPNGTFIKTEQGPGKGIGATGTNTTRPPKKKSKIKTGFGEAVKTDPTNEPNQGR